ncbi:type I methionyl aminopeptidase [Leptospira wolffii]|uniref:Methionine aminopeptidase n=1 Tax=Leptospira wolffii TaxID=409998 RepID=A0A2M9ZDD3_9LEPT|nr:type I methionyl aminopeptidase [Leptospira wolffii]PJZ66426.1 type I methionyl aminopeptidase [Leptospira wolffii]TGK60008.1 type I methionyl aminopeptidase [Leptospira wolffii]TGK72352.1 type I methionyl aminopeptidase [Leptospira wolffii]TGK76015.1 type I methionyl aminopeptidase [Leptospira wolffii]TGL30267.1 type I methionyl aminopeptidase [Leptospira wolffii]
MIYIKNKSEIEKMRAAGKLAAALLDYISGYIKPGVSTLVINDLCEEFTKKKGGKSAPLGYKGFPKSVCTSINDVVCHGIPKATDVLKDGDIVNVDVTPIVDGYHGDSSRTFIVGGKTSPEAERLVKDAERAMWVGIEQVKPGNRVSDIANAIDDYLTPKGYGIVRDLMGHGIGRGFHEEPQIPHYRSNRKLAKLEPGMTFTIEPMVNLGTWEVIFSKKDGWTVNTKDGKWSAQFEHTILVTEKGYEILTLPE